MLLPDFKIIEDFLNDYKDEKFYVEVHFSGAGDSGEIDEPETNFNHPLSAKEIGAIRDFVSSALPAGWEIDDGMDGDVIICLKNKIVSVDMNYKIDDSESFIYDFSGNLVINPLTEDYKNYVEEKLTTALKSAKLLRYLTDKIWIPYPEIKRISCSKDSRKVTDIKFVSKKKEKQLYERLSNETHNNPNLDVWLSLLNIDTLPYSEEYGIEFQRPDNPLQLLNSHYDRLAQLGERF